MNVNSISKEVNMDTSFHTMNTLFSQLGLPDDDVSVEAFIREHHHLNNNVPAPAAQSLGTKSRKIVKTTIMLKR